jgi:hypothetical protein
VGSDQGCRRRGWTADHGGRFRYGVESEGQALLEALCRAGLWGCRHALRVRLGQELMSCVWEVAPRGDLCVSAFRAHSAGRAEGDR